jgi:hypothetical protein
MGPWREVGGERSVARDRGYLALRDRSEAALLGVWPRSLGAEMESGEADIGFSV